VAFRRPGFQSSPAMPAPATPSRTSSLHGACDSCRMSGAACSVLSCRATGSAGLLVLLCCRPCCARTRPEPAAQRDPLVLPCRAARAQPCCSCVWLPYRPSSAPNRTVGPSRPSVPTSTAPCASHPETGARREGRGVGTAGTPGVLGQAPAGYLKSLSGYCVLRNFKRCSLDPGFPGIGGTAPDLAAAS
jgi:hypothetical protein